MEGKICLYGGLFYPGLPFVYQVKNILPANQFRFIFRIVILEDIYFESCKRMTFVGKKASLFASSDHAFVSLMMQKMMVGTFIFFTVHIHIV